MRTDVIPPVAVRTNVAITASGVQQSLTGRLTSNARRTAFDQPHGGSLRATGPANAPPAPLPACAPSVRNTAGGFRPTARNLSRMAAACGQPAPPTRRQRPFQRAHLRCGTQPGASAQPLSRVAVAQWLATSAAWRQPAGNRPRHRATSALSSARTFGAEHSRGLPPNRSAAWLSVALGCALNESCARHGVFGFEDFSAPLIDYGKLSERECVIGLQLRDAFCVLNGVVKPPLLLLVDCKRHVGLHVFGEADEQCFECFDAGFQISLRLELHCRIVQFCRGVLGHCGGFRGSDFEDRSDSEASNEARFRILAGCECRRSPACPRPGRSAGIFRARESPRFTWNAIAVSSSRRFFDVCSEWDRCCTAHVRPVKKHTHF